VEEDCKPCQFPRRQAVKEEQPILAGQQVQLRELAGDQAHILDVDLTLVWILQLSREAGAPLPSELADLSPQKVEGTNNLWQQVRLIQAEGDPEQHFHDHLPHDH